MNMSTKSKKLVLLVIVMITITSMVAACGSPSTATQAPATNAPAGKGPFTIGEYRTQMIAELQEVNKEYMDKGITTDLVVESADTDVAGQIQQLQNLM